MNIEEYISKYYSFSKVWFADEVKQYYHQSRISDILDIKEYLGSNKHKILNRTEVVWNGKKYYPKIMVIPIAKVLFNISTAYLLQNDITISGKDEVVSIFKNIHKQGNYYRTNWNILDQIQKYGNCYEYVYLDNDGIIRSKLIDVASGYPVYNEKNELISFIEYYIFDNVSYYTIFYSDKVEEYSNDGGTLQLTKVSENISGLPIHYHNNSEVDECFGSSDLNDWITIIDGLEEITSHALDLIYRMSNPIGVAIGQKLSSGGLNSDIIGNGINLDNDSDFKFVTADLNWNAIQGLYKTLKETLLNVSCTPAVALNNTDISNLSTVSIRLLFALSDLKAGLYSQYLLDGFMQRFKKIRRILEMSGQTISDEDFNSLNVVFTPNKPFDSSQIINDLKTLREIGAISLESLIEQNPYTNDKVQEMERLQQEGKETL